jgi:hypothetical protein
MYFFCLGRNTDLSRSELQHFCQEIYFDPEKNLLLAQNLRWENLRGLPKMQEQIFLDRLGGTIKMGKILGEFFAEKDLKECILAEIKTGHKKAKSQGKKSDIYKLALMVMGGGKKLMQKLQKEIIAETNKLDFTLRLENFSGKNLSSGALFDRKVLRGGGEFLIVKKGDSFLLGPTLASQNLRNYVLRDRRKPFRDAKMGMLPPKLAQILINLANPQSNEIIYDPFCGSGTVCGEAAVMGYASWGSDIKADFVRGAEQNFLFLAEKFRFAPDIAKFSVSDAKKILWDTKESGVIVTEGFLGENFDSYQKVSLQEINQEGGKVIAIWERIFQHLKKSQHIKKVVFCLPCWFLGSKKISLSERLFSKIPDNFEVINVTEAGRTFIYQRGADTRVGREICIVQSKA